MQWRGSRRIANDGKSLLSYGSTLTMHKNTWIHFPTANCSKSSKNLNGMAIPLDALSSSFRCRNCIARRKLKRDPQAFRHWRKREEKTENDQSRNISTHARLNFENENILLGRITWINTYMCTMSRSVTQRMFKCKFLFLWYISHFYVSVYVHFIPRIMILWTM